MRANAKDRIFRIRLITSPHKFPSHQPCGSQLNVSQAELSPVRREAEWTWLTADTVRFYFSLCRTHHVQVSTTLPVPMWGVHVRMPVWPSERQEEGCYCRQAALPCIHRLIVANARLVLGTSEHHCFVGTTAVHAENPRDGFEKDGQHLGEAWEEDGQQLEDNGPQYGIDHTCSCG